MKIFEFLLLFSIFLYLSFISLIDINVPWSEGHHGFIGGEKSRPAIYWLKFGYLQTKFGQLVNKEWELGKEKYIYNVHHPIGLPFLISLSFRIFGISEASARIVTIPINFSIVIFLYLFVRSFFNRKIAIYSIILFTLSPMFFYIRNFISTEVFCLPFILATLYFYWKSIKEEKSKFLYLSIFIFFLGALFSDWWIYFVIPPIILHTILFKKERKIMLFIPFSLLAFSLYLLHTYLLTGSLFGEGSHWGSLLDRFLFRTNLSKESWRYNISLFSLVEKIMEYSKRYFTLPLFSLYLLSLFLYFIRLLGKREEETFFLIFTTLSFSSILFIFSNITWIHDFFVVLISPFVPIFPSLLIVNANKKTNFQIIFFICLVLVILSQAIPTYQQIRIWFLTSSSIVKFVATHPGNFLVTYSENPDYHQFRFYSDLRETKTVKNKEELLSAISNGNYSYIIVMPDRVDRELFYFLKENFKYESISEEYIVFYLRGS